MSEPRQDIRWMPKVCGGSRAAVVEATLDRLNRAAAGSFAPREGEQGHEDADRETREHSRRSRSVGLDADKGDSAIRSDPSPSVGDSAARIAQLEQEVTLALRQRDDMWAQLAEAREALGPYLAEHDADCTLEEHGGMCGCDACLIARPLAANPEEAEAMHGKHEAFPDLDKEPEGDHASLRALPSDDEADLPDGRQQR